MIPGRRKIEERIYEKKNENDGEVCIQTNNFRVLSACLIKLEELVDTENTYPYIAVLRGYMVF